jgi:hypothetical protein
MAQDLLAQQQSATPRFCAVLRAVDTGRIASIGTVLRIVNVEEQYEYGTSKISRILLTCQAENLAEIRHVTNGAKWSEKRLVRSDEYLLAQVRPLVDDSSSDDDPIGIKDRYEEKLSALMKDFQAVKTMYQLNLGGKDFPPGMVTKLGDAIQDAKQLSNNNDNEEMNAKSQRYNVKETLWRIAEEWQSICYTLRQGQQSLLSAERNERMIDAACAKGGPLKLPIHMEDLEPDDRRVIQLMETQAQRRHIELGMDPVLDFQVLISLDSLEDRLDWLSHMIVRERQRLEEVASRQYA